MKNIVFPLIGCLILVACAKKDQLHEQMMPGLIAFFQVQLGQAFDETKNHITITKVDTLTEKDRLEFKAKELLRQFEMEHEPELKMQKEELALFEKQYQENPIAAHKEQLESAREDYVEMEAEIQSFKREIEETKVKAQTADSIHFFAYRVHGFFTYTSKSKGSQDIIMSVIMNYRFSVIPVEDILSY